MWSAGLPPPGVSVPAGRVASALRGFFRFFPVQARSPASEGKYRFPDLCESNVSYQPQVGDAASSAAVGHHYRIDDRGTIDRQGLIDRCLQLLRFSGGNS